MITGIAVVLPYEPAVTAVLASVSARSTLAEPLKLTADAVASPLALKLREVCKVVAVPALPLALPVSSPALGRLRDQCPWGSLHGGFHAQDKKSSLQKMPKRRTKRFGPHRCTG